jgi:hypothetical protein
MPDSGKHEYDGFRSSRGRRAGTSGSGPTKIGSVFPNRLADWSEEQGRHLSAVAEVSTGDLDHLPP